MNLNLKKFPLTAAFLGILTALLRTGLLALGTDEKGLLIPWHPLDILCWTAVFAALIIFTIGIWKCRGSNRYEHNFSPSLPASLGTFALAVCIAATVMLNWTDFPKLDRIRNICGLLAAAGLIWAALCRWQGKKPFFGCHGMACLYLTLYAVSHYQTWCSQPQLQNYVFSMASIIFLSLFGYYQTAFDVEMGKRRMQLFTGLAAGFFCVAALPGAEDKLLYLGGAVWALTGLCRPDPVTRRPNPFAETSRNHAHESA